MKSSTIIILAITLLIFLIFSKYVFKIKEGAYMALANSGDNINFNTSKGIDLESNTDGNISWCMQRCLDRSDCQVVVVNTEKNCWLKKDIAGLGSNPYYNTYIKIPDA